MIFKKLIKYLVYSYTLLCMTFLTNSALAGSSGTTFTVTSTVTASCNVAASNMAFGSYILAQLTQTSTITVTCTNGTAYQVLLNAGTGPSATTSTRVMTGPTVSSVVQYLSYSLSATSGGTTWGATSGAGGTGVSGTGNGAAQALTVYGSVPANQTAAVGSYTDTITVTIFF